MSEVKRVVRELTAAPRSLEEATSKNGLPTEPGLYSWWARRGSIPGVPSYPHPMVPSLDLYYVGLAPSSARSAARIRSRVIGNHIRGNTGGSTLKLSLASLLFETKGWEPVARGKKALLKPEDNQELTRWQHQHLQLCWATHPEPWTIEREVIQRLQPPLNVEGNRGHPFAPTVIAARKHFKEAATPLTVETARHGMAPVRSKPPAKGARVGRVTLHEEIAAILREHDGWMTTQEIADAVNERGSYSKKDGSAMDAFQIHGRSKNYPDLFERDGSKVRLKM